MFNLNYSGFSKASISITHCILFFIVLSLLGCKDEGCWSYQKEGLSVYEGCNSTSRLVTSGNDYTIYLESETGDMITIMNGDNGPEVRTKEVGTSVGNFLISNSTSDVVEYEGVGTRNGYVDLEVEFGDIIKIEWWDLICIEDN